MFFVSSYSGLCLIKCSHVLSLEWRCSWGSADRRCSNYIWVIGNFIAQGASYIRDLTVYPTAIVNICVSRHFTCKAWIAIWGRIKNGMITNRSLSTKLRLHWSIAAWWRGGTGIIIQWFYALKIEMTWRLLEMRFCVSDKSYKTLMEMYIIRSAYYFSEI